MGRWVGYFHSNHYNDSGQAVIHDPVDHYNVKITQQRKHGNYQKELHANKAKKAQIKAGSQAFLTKLS